MGGLTKSEVGREEDVEVPMYRLGEMTLSPSSPMTFVDLVSSRRCLGLSGPAFEISSVSMGTSVSVGDPPMDVGGYMLGETGPSNSDRPK